MARRIVLTMLALIGALLVTTVVPLGLITTGHERSSFREDTELFARALAGFAEDRLDDQSRSITLSRALTQAHRAGEQVRVYDVRRRVIMGTGGTDLTVPASDLTAALHGRTVLDTSTDDRLRVIVPVTGDRGDAIVGVVVLSRSSDELEERVSVLWAWLISVGGGRAGRRCGGRDRAGPLGQPPAERAGWRGPAAGRRRAGHPVVGRARAARGSPAGAELQHDGGPAGIPGAR